MNKTSADIEREVEASRGQLDRTVEALKEKMQPRELIGEASRYMGAASNRTVEMVIDQARQNPVPFALIGLGVAWLAMGRSRRRTDARGYVSTGQYETYEGYDEGGAQRLKAKVGEAVDAAKAKVSDAVDHAKGSLGEARMRAGETADAARTRLEGMADTVQSRASDVGRQARDRYEQTLEHEPLVIGAIGLAIGAAVGAALPSTSAERRYIGPTRERVLGRGSDVAKEQLGELKDAAQRAYGQVKDDIQRQVGAV